MNMITKSECFDLKMTVEFESTMRQLAGWYAGHHVPSAHHVALDPSVITVQRATGLVAVTWNVYDRHSIVVGDVTWNEAFPDQDAGWSYSIRF